MTHLRIKTAVGPTILLSSGAYFDLLDPHGSTFTIEDIAHGLANTCRFAGQCREFYSVAEHSWHASFLVPVEYRLRALMHDAAEAFIGDVTRPLKSLLPDYKMIERNVEDAIQARFGTGDWNIEPIKRADLQMLRAEQLALMPNNGDRWACLDEVEVADVNLRCWSPPYAREAFRRRFDELSR